MTVAELIEQLRKQPQDAEVVVNDENGEWVSPLQVIHHVHSDFVEIQGN